MEFTKWFLDQRSVNLDLNLDSSMSLGRRSMVFKEEMVPTTLPNNRFSTLEAELNQMSEENKRLNERLSDLQANYNTLQTKLADMMAMVPSSPPRKRSIDQSIEDISTSSDDSCKRIREEVQPKISKLCVRTDPSDASLVVKDGYHWRKYGQKVTRDNPCPRAYFRCSFAPACPVKKKVQRSAEDRTMLVATYEGDHTHARPSSTETLNNSNLNQCQVSIHHKVPSVTLDLTQPQPRQHDSRGSSADQTESPVLQKRLVEQMASSLTKNPNFTAALVSAISGQFLRLSPDHSR